MDDQILIIFGRNIPDTIGQQMTIYIPVASNVCFLHYLQKTKQAKYYLTLWLTLYLIVQLCNCWQ